MLLLGTSATSFLGGSFHPGGTWSTTTLGSGSATTPAALTADAAGDGVGLLTPSSSSLAYTIWHAGTWSAPANVAVAVDGGALSVRSPPAIDANNGAVAHAVYQDASFKYWYVAYGGSWSTPQPITASGGAQDFGPFTASIAALGANASVGFFDGAGSNVNYAATTDLVSGAWGATVDIAGPTVGGNTNNIVVPPVVVPLGGTDVLLAYIDMSYAIHWIRRTAGTWALPLPLATASTVNYLAMAPLPNGGAILAFCGTDSMLYWSVYAGGAWSTVLPFSTPNVKIDGTPAVSHGVGGDTAEIAYVTGGAAYHARLTGGVWSKPVEVGGANLIGVALAATP